MTLIKQVIKQGFRSAGWEISHVSASPPTPAVASAPETIEASMARLGLDRLMENFLSLARAEEHRLGLPKNDRRATLLARQYGTPPAEALYIVKAIMDSRAVQGDVCEFGCAQGETSALIANEILASDKVFHIFDSFEGLPKPTDKDRLKDDIFKLGSMAAYAGQMACPEDMVRSRLEAVGLPRHRYQIHQGFIARVLEPGAPYILPTQVSCAYVDFDFYEPIQQTLDFLHRITPSGAIILVDDYDFFSTGAKTAVDEFMAEHDGNYLMDIPDTDYGYFAVLTKRDSLLT